MPLLTPQQLGQLIFNANPYTVGLPPMQPESDDTEQQVELGTWQFKNVAHTIEKALRISYTYTDAQGITLRDYLLIGFEGGGGY